MGALHAEALNIFARQTQALATSLRVRDLVRGPIAIRLLILWACFSGALLINRGPIYFPDTTAYIRIADAAAISIGLPASAWSDRLAEMRGGIQLTARPSPTPLSGRSVYYGFALWLLGTLGAALAQGLLAAGAVVLAAQRLKLPFALLPAIVLLSSATVFAALLMPDLLAALAILSCAMILPHWQDMSRIERVFWWGLLVASVVSHTATLLIVAAILTIWALWRRGGLSWLPVLTTLIVGVAAELSFVGGVNHVTGSPPLRPPFLSARLIADGPGRAFLDEQCPRRADFTLCRFYGALPTNSDAILWTENGGGFISMSRDVQRAWSQEDLRFTAAVAADRPLAVGVSSALAVAKQAFGYKVSEVTQPLGQTDRLTEKELARYSATAIARSSFPVWIWNGASPPLLIVSLMLLIGAWRRLPLSAQIIILGVIMDVAICGALSTPHDRYLMRVAWLLPLAALTVRPSWLGKNSATPSTAKTPLTSSAPNSAEP